jgi:hypothetical protein
VAPGREVITVFGWNTSEAKSTAEDLAERLAPLITEIVRRELGTVTARLDRVDPAGRVPEAPVDDLRAEEKTLDAIRNWQERGGGRARDLTGSGLNGETLAKQMVLEATHGFGVIPCNVPGHPEQEQAARALEAASQEARRNPPVGPFGPGI